MILVCYTILTIVSLLVNPSFGGFKNNVCSTYHDYFMNMENNSNCWYNFAAESKISEIIQRTGYPLIEYKVQTKDGYILTVFRIPSVHPSKPAVFMLHGIVSTATIFVSLGRNSLAFLLADLGYDVWLGNYRGNSYSEGHTHLNVTQKEYWDYGVDEIALIDVPTMLQLVTFHSGDKGKIIYIGHSLGTTAGMMYGSEYPEHARDTVKLFVFMSPAYKLNHMLSPYRLAFPLLKNFLRLANGLNFVQILSRGYGRNFTGPACLASPALMLACVNILNLFLGPLNQLAPETIPVFLNQLPGGTSLKTWTYISEAVRGRFRKYDYGGRNIFIYGTDTPPEYNISKIQVPVYMMYSRNDWATSRVDSLNFYRSLPKEVRYGSHEVTNWNFNHYDFLFGRNAKKLVYDVLIKVLDKVTSSKTNPSNKPNMNTILNNRVPNRKYA